MIFFLLNNPSSETRFGFRNTFWHAGTLPNIELFVSIILGEIIHDFPLA
jgi:hypothetical protein